MGIVWEITPSEALEELAGAYTEVIHQALVQLARVWAARLEAYAKEHARWTDRTGNARQTLYSEVYEEAGRMIEIILSHGVDYGKYLEWSNAGRFAIVSPTLDAHIPQIWQDVVALLS